MAVSDVTHTNMPLSTVDTLKDTTLITVDEQEPRDRYNTAEQGCGGTEGTEGHEV